MTETGNPLGTVRRPPLGNRGVWFAAIWLFFLLDPLLVAVRELDTLDGVAGLLLTLAFAAFYLRVFIGVRRDRAEQLSLRPPMREAVTDLAVLVALGTGMTITLGQVGTTAAVYCAVVAMMVFPFRIGATITLVI